MDGLATMISAVVSSPSAQDYITGKRQVAAAQAKADMLRLYRASLPEMVSKLKTAAAANPAIRANLQEEWPFLLQGDLDTAGQCVTNHPQIFNRYTTVKVEADNSVVVSALDQVRDDVTASIAQMSELVTQHLQEGGAQLAVINNSIAELSGGVGQLSDLLLRPPAPRAPDLREQITEARQLIAATGAEVLDEARHLVAGASFFASLLGEDKLAADITKLGTAAVTVGESLLGIADAGAALAGALVTGNPIGMISAAADLFGSVMTIAGLWDAEATQPTPEEVILVEVQRLHQRLDDISGQISRSFALVDQRLVTFHRETMSALAEIASEQHITRARVEQIHATLLTVEQRVTVIDRNILRMFEDAAAHDLNIAVERGLGYRERDTTGAGLSFAQFDEFASEFALWSTTVARNSIYQPLTATDTSDAQLSHELSKGTLAGNVCLINRALMHRRLPGFTTDSPQPARLAPLVNADVWAVAANAYAQLQAEWPRHAAPVDARRLDIQDAGLALSDAVRTLAASPVFAPLINGTPEGLLGVRGRVRELADAINALLTTFHQHVLPGLLGRTPAETGSLDLFGPADQVPPVSPWMLPDTMTTPHGQPLPLPRDGIARQLPSDVALYCLLTHDTLTVDAAFTQHKKTEERYNPKTGETFTVTRTHAICTAHIRHGDRTIRSVQISSLPTTEDPETATRQHWDELSAAFNTAGPTNRLPLDYSAHNVAALSRHWPNAYVWLEQQLAAGACKDHTTPLHGARMLLEHTVRLAFPNPRAHDDIIRDIFDGTPCWDHGLKLPDAGEEHVFLRQTDQLTSYLQEHPGSRPGDWLTAITGTSCGYLTDRITHWQSVTADHSYPNPIPTIADPLLRQEAAAALIALTHADNTSKGITVAALPLLSAGSTGPDVRRLQGLLRAADTTLTDRTLTIDGQFGAQTGTVLRRYQQRTALTATETTDTPTWQHLLGLN